MTHSSSPLFGSDYVRAIAPYIGGRPISEVAREFDLDPNRIVKLASNENPLGMPASARAAIQQALDDLARYPDSNAYDLKQALIKKFAVPAEWITIGNGSNDILELATRVCVAPGQSVIFSEYAFAVYPIATQGVGGIARIVPSKNYGHDLQGMLAAIDNSTRLIFIANPNNPTGTSLPANEIETFLTKVPSHIVVVIDEAYTEYLDEQQRYDAIAWVKRFPNLLVSRTFSKAYGLAGLRIGFGIAQPELTALLNRIRQPFNVNSLAQAAAIAALNDTAFLQRSAELNKQGYIQLTNAFKEMGVDYVPSAGNFILFKISDEENSGARTSHELLKRGVIVRPVASYGLPHHIRVTIGLPEENTAFIEALKQVLA